MNIRITLLFCFLLISVIVVSQNVTLGTYYCYDSNDSLSKYASKIKVVKSTKRIWFEFYESTRALFVDTIINDSLVTLRKEIFQDTFAYRSGSYIFFQRGSAICFKYFDVNSKKKYVHTLYRLKRKDTTKYVDLLSGIPTSFGFLRVRGIAWYTGDTLVGDNRKIDHACYVIDVKFHQTMHQVDYTAKVFVDKQSLLAIKFIYYDKNSQIASYYVLNF